MRAIAVRTPGPITDPAALVDIELPRPEPAGRDLLVEIRAVSVNPVDTKVRRAALPEGRTERVLGWDAAGIVTATGPDATLFKPGDAVLYAGSIGRPGTNAQFHLVDERIVGRKPASLDWAEAAAIPLTAITAWEVLFDRLRVGDPVPGAAPAILIIGGAGGVGSMAVQLVRQLTDLTVIATASRRETADWATALGAHHVIDHSRPLAGQVAALGLGQPGFVFPTTHTEQHLPQIAELIAPQGRMALIDDIDMLKISLLKSKAVSMHPESMFTRSTFQTPDMDQQRKLLNEVSALIDAGRLRTTLTDRLSPISAVTLREAHARIETATTRGKIAVEGWPAD